MSPSTRFVWYVIPTTDLDFQILGTKPWVYREAPKGPFAEVRGASRQEVGLFALKALPRTARNAMPANTLEPLS